MTRDTDLIRRALLNIREISMTLADEYGNPWIESNMIEREVAAALAALSAPVQEPPAPAPVVPAEGLDDLLLRFDAMRNRYAVGMLSVSDAGVLSEVWDALRSAPPVGAQVKPLTWRADGYHGQALVASALGLDVFYRVDGKPGNWTLTSPGAREYVQTPGYETRAAAQAAASVDFERRIRAALLPAGEGE